MLIHAANVVSVRAGISSGGDDVSDAGGLPLVPLRYVISNSTAVMRAASSAPAKKPGVPAMLASTIVPTTTLTTWNERHAGKRGDRNRIQDHVLRKHVSSFRMN